MKRFLAFTFLQLIGIFLFAEIKIESSADIKHLTEDGKIIYESLKQIDIDDPKGIIQINSGYRTVEKQAAEMLSQTHKQLIDFYGEEATYVAEIEKVQKTDLSKTVKLDKVAAIIKKATADPHGPFVSRHLSGEAIDIQKPPDPEKADKLKADLGARGIKVKDESKVEKNCFHLSFGGQKVKAYTDRKQKTVESLERWNDDNKKESSLTKSVLDFSKTEKDSKNEKGYKEGGVSMKMDVTDESFADSDKDASGYAADKVFPDDAGAKDSMDLTDEENEDNE